MIGGSLDKWSRWGRLWEVAECGGGLLYCWNLKYFMVDK